MIETLNDSYYQLHSSPDGAITLQLSREIGGILTQPMVDGKSSSKLTLHQSVRIDNYGSIAAQFWGQLDVLNMIKDSIIQYKETRDPNALAFNALVVR